MSGAMVWMLDERLWFPDPRKSRSDGLVAVGGDLSMARLLLGYRTGVFPWTTGPVTWWSPDPRAIFDLSRIHVPRSLERTLRKGAFRVTWDQEFRAVIEACATAPRAGSPTWITAEFVDAYVELHQAGHAHSIEVWHGDELAGGVVWGGRGWILRRRIDVSSAQRCLEGGGSGDGSATSS